jgi:FkbM family methyltransferase
MLGRFLVDLIKHGIAGPPSSVESVESIKIIPLDDINCLVNGRHGWFLANQYDLYLGRALINYGEYGEIEHEFLNSLLHTGDHVIEIGANIGTHTVGLSKAVGPEGVVVAIEAQPAIFRVLCANLALNGISNVTPYWLGCGAQKGTMNVPTVDYYVRAVHNSGGISLNQSGNGIPVPIVTLDELIPDCSGIQLLKIDVEGMEREVLVGASQLINKYRPLLYVENDRIEKSQDLVEWIMAAGYRLWWHIPPLFNPRNFFHLSENIYGEVASFNMLCVPAETSLTITDQMQELTDSSFHILKTAT